MPLTCRSDSEILLFAERHKLPVLVAFHSLHIFVVEQRHIGFHRSRSHHWSHHQRQVLLKALTKNLRHKK